MIIGVIIIISNFTSSRRKVLNMKAKKEDIKFAEVFEQIYLETNHPDRLFHCSRVINLRKS